MRALVLVSALAATMTTAVYASPKGLQNRQDPIEGDLNHCLTACLAQQGIDIHCSVASNGGNPAQCLCNPAAEAAVTSCLSQACSSVTGAEDFAEVYPALCQYTANVPRDETSGELAAGTNSSETGPLGPIVSGLPLVGGSGGLGDLGNVGNVGGLGGLGGLGDL